MKKLLPVGIVIGVLAVMSLICSNSIQGEHAQANNTLAMMTNLKLADTMKTQAITIDHMAWGYIIGFVVLAVVIIALILILSKAIGKSNQGNTNFHDGNPQLPAGYPRYVSFGRAGQEYIRQLSRNQKDYLLQELLVLVSQLRAELGYTPMDDAPLLIEAKPRAKKFGMVKKNETINWG